MQHMVKVARLMQNQERLLAKEPLLLLGVVHHGVMWTLAFARGRLTLGNPTTSLHQPQMARDSSIPMRLVGQQISTALPSALRLPKQHAPQLMSAPGLEALARWPHRRLQLPDPLLVVQLSSGDLSAHSACVLEQTSRSALTTMVSLRSWLTRDLSIPRNILRTMVQYARFMKR